MMEGMKWLPIAVFAIAAVPASGLAQASTGIVSGRIIDRGTQRPISGASVLIAGTTIGTQTNDEGVYRIPGVPAGAQTIRALRIGYQANTQPVTVVAGQTVTADITLAVTAVQLDVQVVTATGQTQRQRESGASVATIDTSTIVAAANPNLVATLGARAPGVTVLTSSGTTGSSSKIRIRGSNSLSLSNDPLIIVDGIRVNNSQTSFSYGVGGQSISRFNDINPADVESIDIIKGPAGVALYGTAAANGVIQVTTRKGRAGRARWNAFGEYGTIQDRFDYPSNFANVGRTTSGATTYNCNIDAQARGLCTDQGQLASFNPLQTYTPYTDGSRQLYGLSTAGGSDVATYRFSGTFEDEKGLVVNNYLRRRNFNGNVRAQLSPKFDATVTTNFQVGDFALPQNENNALGYLSAGLLGKAFNCAPGVSPLPAGCQGDTLSFGYFSTRPQEFFFIQSEQNNNKFTGGLTLNWQPVSWLRATGQAGADVLNRSDAVLTPPNRTNYNTGLQQGSVSRTRLNQGTYTANGSATATFDLPRAIVSTTTLGGQFVREATFGINAFGAVLLGGTESLQGASARKDVGETNAEVVTVAGYARQQFASADRRFLAFSLRADDNSAFGSDYGLVYYPGVEGSWVLSEEEFFPKFGGLEQFRIRASYGKSGQRPGFRQAQTFFSPVSVTVNNAELPAAVVGGTGNPALRPEITAETEGGFDASFLNGRLGFQATAFAKTTNDALVARPLAPSLGAATSQFVNLGRIDNRGVEMQVNAVVLDMAAVKAEFSANYSRMKNEVKDIGDVPPIIFNGSTQRHTVGFPAGAYFQRGYTFQDRNGDGLVSRVNCPGQPRVASGPECEVQVDTAERYIGSSIPTREFNFQPRLTLFGNLRATALVDYRGGFYLWNQSREFRCFNFANCRDSQDRTSSIADQAKYVARAYGAFTDPATRLSYGPTSAGYIEKADFVRLREVSLAYTLPTSILSRARGLRNATLTVAAQNLGLWTDYTGFDPEVNQAAGAGFTAVDFFSQPPVRRVTARVSVDF